MRLLIKMAIRNVHRNMKPTMMNGIGITFAVILLLLALSISRGVETQITLRNIKFETGALSVNISKEAASLQNKAPGDSLINLITNFLENNLLVSDYNFRIAIPNSILYFQNQNQKVYITGLMPKETTVIKEMYEVLDGDTDIDNSKEVIISDALSELLDISIGDNCSVMVQSVDGAVNFEDFVVAGIFRYTSQINKFNVYMNYEEAMSLYNSNLPSKILINLEDLNHAGIVKAELLKELGCHNGESEGEIECRGTKISSYQDHMGTAKSISGINKYGMLMIAVFLILISFIGIWSMQTENINTRRKEIGTLLSYGFKRTAIKQIFIIEILYTSVVFFTVGFVITYIVIYLININNGIYLGESASFAFGSAIVNPVLIPKDVCIVFLTTVFYPLLATLISLNTLNKSRIIELLNVK